MNPSWRLPSNNGWTAFAGEIRRRFALADGRSVLLARIKLSGEFWRRDPLEEDEWSADVVADFDLRLPQFVLDDEALRGLLDRLDTWFIRFDARQAQPAKFEVELAALQGQQLSISFEAGKDRRLTTGHLSCLIRCCSERLKLVEVAFPVDQSCIRLFRDDLQKLLRTC